MKNLENLTCSRNTSLIDAMRIIDRNSYGLVFVTDKQGQLEGCISDGDIRRFLIKTMDLSVSIDQFYNPNPLFIPANLPKAEWGQYVQNLNPEIRSKLYPVLDSDRHIIEFYEPVIEFRVPISSPSLDGKEMDYVMDCVQTSWISSQGKYINLFEDTFSKFLEVPFSLTTSNGTTALHLALKALDISPGDEVIVPALTFAATINVVLHCGATPVIVDVREDSWCIDPDLIEKAITTKTKAVIPVHIYGQACDMESIMTIARKHKLYVIEDCAESIGAKFKGQFTGNIGDIGCFSFFGNKIITTGEGGMCTTSNPELYAKMKKLRDHGINRESSRMYFHDVVGFNYRMTNMQAAIGCAQLERIDSILEKRKKIEQLYKEKLIQISNLLPQLNIKDSERVCWLVSYLCNDIKADVYIKKLKSYNIDARPFFYSLNKMEIYKQYSSGPCPVSEKLSNHGINFPTYNSLTSDEISHICDAIYEVIKL